MRSLLITMFVLVLGVGMATEKQPTFDDLPCVEMPSEIDLSIDAVGINYEIEADVLSNQFSANVAKKAKAFSAERLYAICEQAQNPDGPNRPGGGNCQECDYYRFTGRLIYSHSEIKCPQTSSE